MGMISLLASPNSLLYLSFVLVQVKVYVNSALLALNQRQYLRKHGPQQEAAPGELATAQENSKTPTQDV
ncbi:hypothetical protein SCLCIDRAFT_1213216, partial [Scleroderma citrinum Foug A]